MISLIEIVFTSTDIDRELTQFRVDMTAKSFIDDARRANPDSYLGNLRMGTYVVAYDMGTWV
nr:Uncharacterised protein [Streptococcus thermophilus]